MIQITKWDNLRGKIIEWCKKIKANIHGNILTCKKRVTNFKIDEMFLYCFILTVSYCHTFYLFVQKKGLF